MRDTRALKPRYSSYVSRPLALPPILRSLFEEQEEDSCGKPLVRKGLKMKCLRIFFVVAVVAAGTAALAVSAKSVVAGTNVIPTQDVLAKTYKRRCTKCKIISEGTKPIFKCPHCGGSTVPAN